MSKLIAEISGVLSPVAIVLFSDARQVYPQNSKISPLAKRNPFSNLCSKPLTVFDSLQNELLLRHPLIIHN